MPPCEGPCIMYVLALVRTWTGGQGRRGAKRHDGRTRSRRDRPRGTGRRMAVDESPRPADLGQYSAGDSRCSPMSPKPPMPSAAADAEARGRAGGFGRTSAAGRLANQSGWKRLLAEGRPEARQGHWAGGAGGPGPKRKGATPAQASAGRRRSPMGHGRWERAENDWLEAIPRSR